MESVSDTLTVTFDSSPTDKAALCVSRKVNDNIDVLKIVSGEQADILYRLLTEPEQTEIDAYMTSEEGLKSCPFCGCKIVQTTGVTGIPIFICTNREDCGAYITFDSLITSHNPEHAHIYWNKRGGENDKT